MLPTDSPARGGDITKVFGQLQADDCPICLAAPLNAVDAGSRALGGPVRTQCGHMFHRECIVKHLSAGSNFCPMCHAECTVGQLKDIELLADGHAHLVPPARDGIFAVLMREAAKNGWNRDKPSPHFKCGDTKYVMWHKFVTATSTSTLNIQELACFHGSCASERQRRKLGVALETEGEILTPKPGCLHTLASLMEDNVAVENPFVPVVVSVPSTDPAPPAGLEPSAKKAAVATRTFKKEGARKWVQVLAAWEPVLTQAFDVFIIEAKKHSGPVDAALGARGSLPPGPFEPFQRQIAEHGGIRGVYLGHQIHIPEGSGYYRDDRGVIMIGWNGSFDPPCDMAGSSLVAGRAAHARPAPHAAVIPQASLPDHTTSTVIEYLKMRTLLENVSGGCLTHDGSNAPYSWADGIVPVLVDASVSPSSRAPHTVAVGPGGHVYAIWLTDTSEGKALTLQPGEYWQRGRRNMGKLSFVLDNRNQQVRYVLVNGHVVPDLAMPKNGALLRGEWKVPAPPKSGLSFMGDVMRRLLSSIELES